MSLKKRKREWYRETYRDRALLEAIFGRWRPRRSERMKHG